MVSVIPSLGTGGIVTTTSDPMSGWTTTTRRFLNASKIQQRFHLLSPHQHLQCRRQRFYGTSSFNHFVEPQLALAYDYVDHDDDDDDSDEHNYANHDEDNHNKNDCNVEHATQMSAVGGGSSSSRSPPSSSPYPMPTGNYEPGKVVRMNTGGGGGTSGGGGTGRHRCPKCGAVVTFRHADFDDNSYYCAACSGWFMSKPSSSSTTPTDPVILMQHFPSESTTNETIGRNGNPSVSSSSSQAPPATSPGGIHGNNNTNNTSPQDVLFTRQHPVGNNHNNNDARRPPAFATGYTDPPGTTSNTQNNGNNPHQHYQQQQQQQHTQKSSTTKQQSSSTTGTGSNPRMMKRGLIPTPKEIVKGLNEYVIGQSKVKMALAVGVYNHYKRIFLAESQAAMEEEEQLLQQQQQLQQQSQSAHYTTQTTTTHSPQSQQQRRRGDPLPTDSNNENSRYSTLPLDGGGPSLADLQLGQFGSSSSSGSTITTTTVIHSGMGNHSQSNHPSYVAPPSPSLHVESPAHRINHDNKKGSIMDNTTNGTTGHENNNNNNTNNIQDTTFARHVEECEIEKSNIMLLGPTGSGKVRGRGDGECTPRWKYMVQLVGPWKHKMRIPGWMRVFGKPTQKKP